MTTATTVLGMIPMAIGGGQGSEMWSPMAIAVIGGLTVSTVLTEPEYDELSAQACRKVLGNYSESIIAKKYTDVYNKITGKYA